MEYSMIYPSSSQSSVVLWVAGGDPLELDTALIRYKLTSNKMPIYNYNSRQYVAVAQGTTLVTGVLGVNFSVVGYFYGLLEMSKSGGAKTSSAPPTSGTSIPSPSAPFSGTGASTRDYYDHDAQTPVFHNADDITMEVFTSNQDPSNPFNPPSLTSVRVFEGVRFLESETAIDARTGDPIMETFTFFARLGKPKHY